MQRNVAAVREGQKKEQKEIPFRFTEGDEQAAVKRYPMNIQTIPLWPEGSVPGAAGSEDTDRPSITVYPPVGANNGAAVVVCPGGGYGHLADHEGKPVAEWLNQHGATGIVLKYRLAPRYKHPAMLTDVSRAIRTVRHRAGEWGIDPKRVGVLGFSAGGHLASTVSTHFDSGKPGDSDPIERHSSRPDVSILIYPVIALDSPWTHAGSRRNLLGDMPSPALLASLCNEKAVTRETPPTYLVHSTDDKAVPVENSLHYALALKANGIPFGMQVYSHGGHGYGMGKGDPVLTGWPRECAAWLKQRGFFGG
jgi:acetyl esterase/lipase